MVGVTITWSAISAQISPLLAVLSISTASCLPTPGSLFPPPILYPDLIIHPCECGAYVQFAQEARDAGFVTAIALGPEPTGLTIPSLRCTCDGSVILTVDV